MIVWAEGRREDSFHLVSNSILLINDVVNDGSTLPDRLAGCTWDWPIGRRGGLSYPFAALKGLGKRNDLLQRAGSGCPVPVIFLLNGNHDGGVRIYPD